MLRSRSLCSPLVRMLPHSTTAVRVAVEIDDAETRDLRARVDPENSHAT